MSSGWSARGDIGLDVLDRVQRGLNVGMIMSPRDDLMTCRQDEPIASVMARNSMDYSFLPVVCDKGRYLGLFHAAEWFNRVPPERVVGDGFERFSEDLVIGADASIFEFVVTADQRPTRLVVSRDKVAGLISISDLQQLPVRAALFTLITALEIAMAHRVELQWPEGNSEWKELLSDARRGAVDDKIAEARRADCFVSEIALTQFSDKATIIYKARLIEGSRRALETKFKQVEDLRNSLAHANYYAETPETANSVCAVVRTILQIKTALLDGIAASKSPTPDHRPAVVQEEADA